MSRFLENYYSQLWDFPTKKRWIDKPIVFDYNDEQALTNKIDEHQYNLKWKYGYYAIGRVTNITCISEDHRSITPRVR
ncbi:hypothetical protein DICVIV_06671 [Dictyocaulus viviparus]|uniref:Uncharacterized protein n=1 Tax=Dictyocaulus viviparus TaxID=29172 RepID=A0A0D8XRY4_DICVI|nr:hypothetical protein DICVIV_06671 [Dictyocaulus viviparus]